jgi:curved DNA-binding protein
MDYYSTLGVDKNATSDEIKKAYKRLAMKHHPDRGGDTQLFQNISQAYDTLGDPDKRSNYDAERSGQGRTQFHYTSEDPFGPFGQMFGGSANPFEQFFQGRQPRQRAKNRDLNIRCTISLKQSFTGTELEASYNLPSGKKETVVIKVPAGVQSGQTIRYASMGDDTNPNLPRGDLMVNLMVQADANYERRGDDLVCFLIINPVEAMVGCAKVIVTLDDSAIRININPGVQHGTEYLTRGKGFKNLAGYVGNLIVQIRIDIPIVTDPTYREKLLNLYAEISNLTKPNT